jgi:hypothetical protein
MSFLDGLLALWPSGVVPHESCQRHLCVLLPGLSRAVPGYTGFDRASYRMCAFERESNHVLRKIGFESRALLLNLKRRRLRASTERMDAKNT